jgi:hypothetical protein
MVGDRSCADFEVSSLFPVGEEETGKKYQELNRNGCVATAGKPTQSRPSPCKGTSLFIFVPHPILPSS